MRKLFAMSVVLLFMAQVAMPQGMLFNAGACYVSNYSGEDNTTFQSASRPCRLWAASYSTLVRFDATDLSQINAPCTLFITKQANSGWPSTATVWDQNNIEVYLLKGTWQEGSNDVDQVNLTGTASWNYRSYPTAWNTSGVAPGPITSAMARKNTTNANGGPDLNTPAWVVLDPVIVDSMRTGRFTGVMLKPGGGAMYWLTHIGHWLSWGEPLPGVEASGKSLSALSLSASPNPFTSSAALSVSLRSTDRNATLAIYNMNGQKVADLSAQLKSGSSVKVAWNASTLSNGVYLAKLISGNIQLVKRLTLMK